MQKRTILSKLTSVILLLGVIWSVFFISKALLQQPENDNLNFLPKNSIWFMQVDFRKMVEQASTTTIFNRKEEGLNILLEEIITDEDGERRNFLDYGIQINSSILLFGIEEEELLGVLVNLTNEQKFTANFSKKLTENSICYGKDKVGVILVSQNENERKKELLSIAKRILESPNRLTSKSGELIALKLKKVVGFEKVNAAKVNINIENNRLLIKGDLNLSQNYKVNSFPSLKPSGFHVDWQNIPLFVSDSLNALIGSNLANILSISINFKGSELITEPRIAIGINADILIQLPDSVDVTRFLFDLEKEQVINLINDSSFEYANSTFYFKQIDYRTFYIGRSKFHANLLTSEEAILSISGDASMLTTVAGEGLARKLLNIVPLFKASEKLSLSIKSLDLNITKNSEGSAVIEGQVEFEKEKFVINELLKYLLIVSK